MEILEIRSSHDLSAKAGQVRLLGAHSYYVNCRQFAARNRDWQKDKAQSPLPLWLMTLGFERIWITEEESKLVEAAIQSTHSPVALD